MSAMVNDRDVLLQAAPVRNLAPAAGAALILTADTPVFHVSAAGAGSPASIHFTAVPLNITGDVVFTCTAGGALTGTGLTRELAFADMTVQQVTVKATLTYGEVEFSMSLTVSKVADGANGIPGSNGTSGRSARLAFTLIDGYTLNFNPTSVTVDGDTRPVAGTWGETRAWLAAIDSAPVAGQAWFQANGTYDAGTGKTVWTTPYLSNLKVGSLSALAVATGALVFTDTCQSLNGNVAINADGTFRLRSGASGQRVELNPNGFYAFAANGVAVIELGAAL